MRFAAVLVLTEPHFALTSVLGSEIPCLHCFWTTSGNYTHYD